MSLLLAVFYTPFGRVKSQPPMGAFRFLIFFKKRTKAYQGTEVVQAMGSTAGIYAIYYTGSFPSYSHLVTNGIPIYVGKAVPPGARKGNFGLNIDPGQALYKRLKEHAESIRQTSNLDIKDFQCRYLVVDDIWIPLGEALLIANFSPVWNKIIDGFGNHDPGKGRYQQLRSRWDTLHPGRSWAHKCQERMETSEQIKGELVTYLESL